MSGQEQDFLAPIAANLIAEMERTRMTIAQVAAEAGVGERQITRWRGGQEPRWEFVCRLAKVFGREPEWFYADHAEIAA